MTWPDIALGEIAEFRNGLNYTRDNEGTGLRVINVKDFGDRSIPNYDELGELNPHGILRDEALLEHGDIIFVRSNGNKDLVGRSLFVDSPPDNLSFSAFCIRARLSDSVDPRFYAYFFRTPNFRKRLALLGKGTNISNLNQEVLKRIKIPSPSRSEQSKVVTSIRPYYDLIENNRRRIQLLEQSARLLYKEWFVHLRFPGHEHVTITDGVPEGWEIKTVPDVIEINPKESVVQGSAIRYLPMASLSTSGMTVDLSGSEMRAKSTSVRFRNGDVLLARITPCLENGKTAFVSFLSPDEIACGSTEFIILRGHLVSPYFTYCLARTHEFRGTAIKSMIGSSGRQRVQAGCFDDFNVGLPPRLLRDQFDEAAAVLFRQIEVLAVQTQRLASARDLLLPRLMNGEISA